MQSTAILSLSSDVLESLYPCHFSIDDSMQLHCMSAALIQDFPFASSLSDFLAPNSAEELMDRLISMQKEDLTIGTIDLFSIQNYSIWNSKIVRIKDQNCWLICFDVSQLKRANKPAAELSAEGLNVLLKQNEFYTALLNHLPAEVAVFDSDYKFLFVNQRAIKNEELRKWLIGRSEIEYWKSKSLPLEKALNRMHAFKESIAARKMTAVEEVFHPGTENEKHYIRVTTPYFVEDELQFLLSYGVDITALKKTENQLIKQNTELEKVNAELDQFVYSASHNLRAPLLSVKGLLNLISMEDTRLEDRSRFMREIFKSIERLDATIHDIIEYSKNARLEIVPQEVDVYHLIQTAAEDLKFFDQTKVEIRINCLRARSCHSDERRLKSIIHNIISNGIKYSDATKTEQWIECHIEISDEQSILRFQDNGIGIASENQDKVFDMFYRATSQRTGSGLGLYIVKEMVEKLGGTIELTSTPGLGTEITLILPNFSL